MWQIKNFLWAREWAIEKVTVWREGKRAQITPVIAGKFSPLSGDEISENLQKMDVWKFQ